MVAAGLSLAASGTWLAPSAPLLAGAAADVATAGPQLPELVSLG